MTGARYTNPIRMGLNSNGRSIGDNWFIGYAKKESNSLKSKTFQFNTKRGAVHSTKMPYQNTNGISL